jgi:hypothetical protein
LARTAKNDQSAKASLSTPFFDASSRCAIASIWLSWERDLLFRRDTGMICSQGTTRHWTVSQNEVVLRREDGKDSVLVGDVHIRLHEELSRVQKQTWMPKVSMELVSSNSGRPVGSLCTTKYPGIALPANCASSASPMLNATVALAMDYRK